MRPVHGFERPALQWMFVVIGLLLVAVAIAQAVTLRRTRAALDEARTAEANARLDVQQTSLEFARERRARETVTDEATRLRAQATGAASLPTLTLSPLTSRGATPPAPSVEEPPREHVIDLRLLLPTPAPKGKENFSVTVRRWSDGQTIWMRGGLAQSQAGPDRVVTALVTGDVLREGSYEVLLAQVSPAADRPSQVASYEVTVGPGTR